ncbi:F-box domain, cyclin-like protein [Cynara cardunculus var. scolymus]|uniref:F-box domain, cyclin-like protein n=1 Tax=Cynara cardunculus var. scolymus TaxID=59895 RepID=A0A103XWD5_CYNCS|nr:F-box domain, cyclin-like protein [Cynara cardunculus var. scolymus]
MASPSPSPSPSRPCGVAATIDFIGEDLLQNIVARLPAFSFASAACVSRSWNLVCDRVLCRPKLSSACSFNFSLHVAVEEVFNKALSEPIRPHFAIASIGPSFDLQQAHQLITAKLGSKVPVITNVPSGIIGRDAISDEFKEIQWEITEEDDDPGVPLLQPESANRAIMLIVGFLPGMKVEAIPLLKQIAFKEHNHHGRTQFFSSCLGTGETQFKAVLSTGLSPVGPTYKAASVREKHRDSLTWITARREGLRENIDGETIMNQVYDELGDRIQFPTFYIGVTKRRKCSIGQDKVGWMTSLAFHEVLGDNQEYLFVGDVGIKTGDSFRFYHSDSSIALSSNATVSERLRCLKQGSTTGGDTREVFGGLVFTCCGRGESFFGQPNVDSSPFLDVFPGVTFAGTFCGGEIGRGDVNPYIKESQEQKSVWCCLHVYSAVYLVMSYTSSKGS